MEECQALIALAFSWPPDVLDDLTLDRLEEWRARAEVKIKLMKNALCRFG
jgi:hypothetical protein